MSITKSYNKYTDTYYAYETSYIWSEERQKKIQKKVCIGQYDKAGNIISNAKRGRPSRKISTTSIKESDSTNRPHSIMDMKEVNQAVSDILTEIHQIEKSLNELTSKSRELESKVITLQNQFLRKE